MLMKAPTSCAPTNLPSNTSMVAAMAACSTPSRSKVLDGNGINGKKVAFVTGDTQTKSDAARASAKSMIEKDGAIMITGGSSSGVAVAVQALCQEAGVIFMAGLTHSNDTTGKDKKANGFRHFFNSYMSGAALAPVLQEGIRQRPQGLSPDRRLQLGLHQEQVRP
jgi:hypothetical protein